MKINKNNSFAVGEVIIIVIITCVFSVFGGISYGKVRYSQVVNINELSSEEKDEKLNEFIKQYKYIISNYYEPDKIDEEKLLDVALKSILDELGMSDSYSLYMDEDEYTQLDINLDGNYEGLGVQAIKEKKEGPILVVSIIKNSPASDVDIKVGDYITSIDGRMTADMTVEDFSQYVLNSDDKQFVLKINRNAEEKTINIKKGSVELESVSSKVIVKDGKKIGYIYMSIFASNTYKQFKEKILKLEEDKIDGLIIDLRGNTGGHLTEVTKILSLFLNKKRVIYQLEQTGEKVKYYSKGKEDKTYPIVFIGDGTTASAAEVMIISLKENLDAKLVGNKTYGKGTVQELVELTNGDKYKITTKKWLSPNGIWINDTKGIAPDVNVNLNEKYYVEPNDDNDNQLQSAIKLFFNNTK